MQKLLILFLFIAMYVSANSAEILSPYIQLSTNSVTFEAKAYNDYKYIEINSNTGWIASVDTNIFSFNPNYGSKSGTITISGYTNNWAYPRLQTLSIRDSANTLNPQIVKIHQKGSEEYIKINRNSLTLTKLDKSSASISLIANTSWTYKNVPSWLTINRNIGDKNSDKIEVTLEFVAEKLTDNNPRTANIEIVGQFGTSQTVTIVQLNEEPYVKFHTNYMKIPAKLPDGNLYIGVKSNTYWNVSTSDSWLTRNLNGSNGLYNNTVVINMDYPYGLLPRSVTFTAKANGAPTQYLVVEQEAAEPYLTFSVDTLFFTNIPNSSNTISILSNTSWTMTNMPNWLHYKKGNLYNNEYGFYIDNGTIMEEGKIDFITNTALIKTLIVKKLDELPKIQTSVNSVTLSSKDNGYPGKKIKILTNTSLQLKYFVNWININSVYNQTSNYTSNNDTIGIRVFENNNASPRSTTISGEKDGVLYPFLEVVQEGNPAFINFSSTIALEKEANSSKVFDIYSNTSWTITNLPIWVNVNKTSDFNTDGGRIYSLTFTTENKLNTQFRTGTFEILSESLPSKTITVVQLAEEPYLQISTKSMTISDKADVKYSIDVKSNTNWLVEAKSSIVKSDFESVNNSANNYSSWIGYGDNSFTFTSNRNLDSIDILSNLKFYYSLRDTIKNILVDLIQLKTSEFVDLEIVEISTPFDLSDTNAILNKRYNCSVKFKNNSTVPINNIPVSLDIIDCFKGYAHTSLAAMINHIDTGSSNTKIMNFGIFTINRVGNYYARVRVANSFDKIISNNTLTSKCKYFDYPQITKVEDVPLGDFRIYPNPNNGYFTICGYVAIDYLRIVDLLGNTIYEQEKPSNSIALNNINAGVYWVLVTSNGISKMEKLVIY